MATEVTKRVAQIFIDDGQADVTIKGLTAKSAALRRELGKMTIGSPQFDAQLKKLQAVNGDLKRIRSEVAQTNGVWGQMQKTLGPLSGMLAGVFGGAAIAAGIKRSVESFHEHERAVEKLRVGLSKLGDDGKVSIAKIEAEAQRLQENSLFSDEQILNDVTARLVSFGNIVGDNLLRANEAAVDLSTVMDKDLPGAATALGKALNSPVEGMAALQRIGVRLTDDQKALIKEMVETGRVSEAQGVILGELEKRFKGHAAAQAAVMGGQRKLQVATDELSEAIGARFAHSMSDASGVLADLVNGIADFVKPAKSAVEVWEEQSGAVQGLVQNVEPLLTRYDQLAGTTNRSAKEQAEMERIIQEVTTAIPLAATGFDEYGRAIGLSTDKARDFIKNQKDLLQFTHADAIRETQEKLEELRVTYDRLNNFVNSNVGTFTTAGEVYRKVNGELVRLVTTSGQFGGTIMQVQTSQEEQNKVISAAVGMFTDYASQVNGAEQQLAILNGTMTETQTSAAANAAALEETTKRIEQTRAAIKKAQDDIALDRLDGEAKDVEAVRQKYATLIEAAQGYAEGVKELEGLQGQEIAVIREKWYLKNLEDLKKLDDQIKALRAEHDAWRLGQDEVEVQAIRTKYQKLIDEAAGHAGRIKQLEDLRDEEIGRKRQEHAEAQQQLQDETAAKLAGLRTAQVTAELQALDEKHAQERTKAEEQGVALTDILIRQQEERRVLQAELDAAAGADINTMFENLYAEYDKAGLDTIDLQRLHGDALNLLKLQQNKAALDGTKATNAAILQNEKDVANARRKIASDLLGVAQNLLTVAGQDEGSWFEFTRLITLAQIGVDTASAISSLTTASEANPANAVTFGGAGTAQFITGLARITANMASAAALLNKKPPEPPAFEVGGFTDPPNVSHGGWVTTPTMGLFGEAGTEHVSPNWMVEHPTLAPVYHWLEDIRESGSVPQRAFAEGGHTQGTPYTFTKATGMAEQGGVDGQFDRLIEVVERLNTVLDGGIDASISWDLMTKAEERKDLITKDSQIRV